eukprot:50335-Chlamydomonas_euryale.AAC.3
MSHVPSAVSHVSQDVLVGANEYVLPEHAVQRSLSVVVICARASGSVGRGDPTRRLGVDGEHAVHSRCQARHAAPMIRVPGDCRSGRLTSCSVGASCHVASTVLRSQPSPSLFTLDHTPVLEVAGKQLPPHTLSHLSQVAAAHCHRDDDGAEGVERTAHADC